MKKMLSIALAMLVTLSVVGTGTAYAANLTNPVEVGWTPQSVRVYKEGHVHAFDSNGKSRLNDYTDLSFNGNTMKVSGEYRGSNVSTITVVVMTYNDATEFAAQNKQLIEQTASLNDGKYSTEIDMTGCVSIGKVMLNIQYGKYGEEGFATGSLDTYFNASYENGKWQFKREKMKQFMEAVNIVKDAQVDLDEYWKKQDEWNKKTMVIEEREGWKEQVALKAKALELCQGAKSDTEKAYRVYKWMTDTFNPREDIGSVDGIASPLICGTYAKYWDAFMYYLRIPSTTVNGESNVAPHGFNVTYLDGHWTFVDGYMDNFNEGFDTTFARAVSEFDMWSCGVANYKTPDAPPANSIVAKYNITNFKVASEVIPISLATYTINDNNYVKLRDIAKLMSTTSKKFSVSWDDANQCISMQTGANYTSVGGELTWSRTKGNQYGESVKITEGYAVPSTAKVYLNGQALNLQVYTIDNNNYFKLRDIAEKVNFAVGYDTNTRMITLNASKGYSK